MPLGDRRAPQGCAKSAPLRNAPNLSFRAGAGGGPPGQATWHTDPRKPCWSTTTSAVNKMRQLEPPCFLNDTSRRTMRHHADQHAGGGRPWGFGGSLTDWGRMAGSEAGVSRWEGHVAKQPGGQHPRCPTLHPPILLDYAAFSTQVGPAASNPHTRDDTRAERFVRRPIMILS